jgi:prolyl oligopeptidase
MHVMHDLCCVLCFPDGSMMAYCLSKGGSDWCTIHALNLEEGGKKVVKLEEELVYVKFSSLEWTHDKKGLFYNR